MGEVASQEHRRVAVVDDHRTFSELLTIGLVAHPDLTCVGTAADLQGALEIVEHQQPDVVIMDVRLGSDDGVTATATITGRWPDTAVVVLTAYPTQQLLADAVRAGASALLPKDGALGDLLDTVVRARPRLFTVPPQLMQSMLVHDEAPATLLTRREYEVLVLLAAGRDLRSICTKLGISLNTCRGYVKSVLTKLGAHSQLEAVVTAHERGLLGLRHH